jgi:hypothetical protein
MLRLEPAAVAGRAHAALDALGGEPPAAVPPERRAAIADYLLGQTSATGGARARDELADSEAERAWARDVRAALTPLGGDELPEVPAGPVPADRPAGAHSARQAAGERPARSSRVGGVLLLIGSLAVLLAGLGLAFGLFGGGGDDEGDDLADRPTTTATTSDVRPIAQANLTPPSGRTSDALGVAFVVSGQGQQAIRVDAEGLPAAVRQPDPDAGACIFLMGESDRSQFVGCFQDVSREGAASASGVLQDARDRPVDVADFQRVVVTRETGSTTPARPGTTLLSGDLVEPSPDAQGTATTPQGGG